jgi:hypothetical protein
LSIGGKTGSIYNNSHDVKFDWFTGYAEEKKGDGKIAISVVVGHGKYIGKRASAYARLAIKEFFEQKNNPGHIADFRNLPDSQIDSQIVRQTDNLPQYLTDKNTLEN